MLTKIMLTTAELQFFPPLNQSMERYLQKTIYEDSVHFFKERIRLERLDYCLTPSQRLRLYNGAPFSRFLRHAGDTEDVFSA